MSDLTKEQIEELFERSKNDRAIIVGSEVRMLASMALRTAEAERERDEAKALIPASHKALYDSYFLATQRAESAETLARERGEALRELVRLEQIGVDDPPASQDQYEKWWERRVKHELDLVAAWDAARRLAEKE